MKTTVLSLLLVCVFMVSPAIGQEGAEVLTNADVITLAEASVPDSIIVAKIEGSQTEFDLSVDGLVALTRAGVGEAVLAAMTKAAAAPARLPPAAAARSFPPRCLLPGGLATCSRIR